MWLRGQRWPLHGLLTPRWLGGVHPDQVLSAGGSALDAVEAAVNVLENDDAFDAGTGKSSPTPVCGSWFASVVCQPHADKPIASCTYPFVHGFLRRCGLGLWVVYEQPARRKGNTRRRYCRRLPHSSNRSTAAFPFLLFSRFCISTTTRAHAHSRLLAVRQHPPLTGTYGGARSQQGPC